LYPRPVANGLSWFQVGELFAAIELFVTEESIRKAPETELNSNCVFVIAVSGVVGGVKLPV
jgi:hypothetical protein